jgi:hypothetical protein
MLNYYFRKSSSGAVILTSGLAKTLSREAATYA